MKTLVFVLVPYTVPPAALLEFAEALLAPHQMRDDDRTTGRYDYLAGSPGSFDDRVAEGILPERMKRAAHGRITTTAQLRDDSIPGAVVTPDGVWHDRDDRDRRSAIGRSVGDALPHADRSAPIVRRTRTSWREARRSGLRRWINADV